jgi:hypothetical protein
VDNELKREVFESLHEMIRLAVKGEKDVCLVLSEDYKEPEEVTKAIEVLGKFRKEY